MSTQGVRGELELAWGVTTSRRKRRIITIWRRGGRCSYGTTEEEECTRSEELVVIKWVGDLIALFHFFSVDDVEIGKREEERDTGVRSVDSDKTENGNLIKLRVLKVKERGNWKKSKHPLTKSKEPCYFRSHLFGSLGSCLLSWETSRRWQTLLNRRSLEISSLSKARSISI